MECIFAIQSILNIDPRNSLPLALTFIDPWNAFGSVAQQYIHNILESNCRPIIFPPVVYQPFLLWDDGDIEQMPAVTCVASPPQPPFTYSSPVQ